jgi:hypothetical protein
MQTLSVDANVMEETMHKEEEHGDIGAWWFALVFSIICLIGIASWYSTPPMELVETQFPAQQLIKGETK